VTGNESADLDSCASSILTAYFYHQSLDKAPTNAFRPDAVIPLLNIPREDLDLRPELLYLLSKLDVNASNLFCLDDLTKLVSDGTLVKSNCHAFLVDFNRLTGTLADLIDDRVVGVLDHHDDEGYYKSANPRIVQKTGSCSSLVVNYWNKQLSGLPTKDEGLLQLACAPLLVDTANLTSKVEKPDLESFELLKKLSEEFPYDSFFQTIQKHKKNLEGMSGRDILRKDYKQWDNEGSTTKLRLGISSVQQSLDWLLNEHKRFDKDILSSARERDVDVYVVMTSFIKDDKFSRELIIYPIANNTKQLIDEFLVEAKEKFQLEPKESRIINSDVMVFNQFDTKSSRKQVGPLLRQTLHGVKLSNI
jgi:exopolyphosphatase